MGHPPRGGGGPDPPGKTETDTDVLSGEDTARNKMTPSPSAPSPAVSSTEKGPSVATSLFLSQTLPAGCISFQLDRF